jgi:predicted nucleotidyltransferase
MTLPDKNSEGFIEQIRERLVMELNPLRIVLFGSRARGEHGPDSDVDLFIVMDSAKSFYERSAHVSSLFRPRDWSLDAFVFTPQEVQEDSGRNGTLVELVEREGKVIYER